MIAILYNNDDTEQPENVKSQPKHSICCPKQLSNITNRPSMENLVQGLEQAESFKESSSRSASKLPRSIYKGVYKCGNKFKAQIQISRVQHYLGLFDDELQAALAYDNHARIILGDKARTNFDTDGSAVALVPAVPMTEPLRQEKLKSEHHAVESKVRESTKSRKRLYIGINQRPTRFSISRDITSSSGQECTQGIENAEMQDSAALLGQLKAMNNHNRSTSSTCSTSDTEDTMARLFLRAHGATAAPIHAHDPNVYNSKFNNFPAYFHTGQNRGTSVPVSAHTNNNSNAFASFPSTAHLQQGSQFHGHHSLPFAPTSVRSNFAPVAPPVPFPSSTALSVSSASQGPAVSKKGSFDAQDVSSSSKSGDSGKSYSTKTSTESMISEDLSPVEEMTTVSGPPRSCPTESGVPSGEARGHMQLPPPPAPLDGQVSHWAGLLQYDAHQPGQIQIWRGTWVPSNDASLHAFPSLKPSPAAFAHSTNHFDYVCDMRFALDQNGQHLIPVSGRMRGIYSHGSAAHIGQDRELFVNFAPSGVAHRYNVTGCGEGDAGEFVVAGQFSAISCVLELARQYVSA